MPETNRHKVVEVYRGFEIVVTYGTTGVGYYGVMVDESLSALALISRKAARKAIDTLIKSHRL